MWRLLCVRGVTQGTFSLSLSVSPSFSLACSRALFARCSLYFLRYTPAGRRDSRPKLSTAYLQAGPKLTQAHLRIDLSSPKLIYPFIPPRTAHTHTRTRTRHATKHR